MAIGLPGEVTQLNFCRRPGGAEAAGRYLSLPRIETGIKNFAPEEKTGRLRSGDQRRGRTPFLIFVSNGRNDIVNGQEGVHHLRIEPLP